MKKIRLFCAFLSMIVCLFSVGCNKIELPVLDEQSQFGKFHEAIKCTRAYRDYEGLRFVNFYPDIDLTDIDKLPVYFRRVPDYGSLKTAIDAFAEKLGLPYDTLEEQYDELGNYIYASSPGKDIGCRADAWGVSVGYRFEEKSIETIENMGICFPHDIKYEISNGSPVLDPDDSAALTEACAPLAKLIGGEDYIYGDCRVDSSVVCWSEDGELYAPVLNVMVSYRNYQPQSGAELLLDFYDLTERVDFLFRYNPVYPPSVSIKLYTGEYLDLCGDFDIIPYDKAQKRFDDDVMVIYDHFTYRDGRTDYSSNSELVADYDMYLVYIENEGFIRPIYMKQDYYHVGKTTAAAWIDAIDR